MNRNKSLLSCASIPIVHEGFILTLITASVALWYNARLVRGRSGFDTRSSHTKDLVHAISLLSIQHFGKERGSETQCYQVANHPPTAAFTVLAQLCGPKANETEMGAALFTKNGEGKNFEFDSLQYNNLLTLI